MRQLDLECQKEIARLAKIHHRTREEIENALLKRALRLIEKYPKWAERKIGDIIIEQRRM